MVGTQFDKATPARMPSWLAGNGPEAAVAVHCQCSLLRNLADFCFPDACSEDEKRGVEDRVVAALDHLGLLATGQYCSIAGLEREEANFLAERRLIGFDLLDSRSHGGAYISDDQCTSIAVNGSDHVCVTMLASGLGFARLWAQLNALDDRLAGALDYAFDKQFGYLTSSVALLGTGLRAGVVLHLPGLAMTNAVPGLVEPARRRRQALHGLKSTVSVPGPLSTGEERQVNEALYTDLTGALYGDVAEAQGDLYLLTNTATLGVSEQEILFHLRHTASDLAAREKAARERLLETEHRRLDDRVARALGVARSARLLGFAEAVSILSSLRLGIDTGLLPGYTFQQLNELLLAGQSAHLKMKAGRECDEWTLSIERADLFRAAFSEE